MKKLVTILMIFLIVPSLLVGCSNTSDTKNTTSIKTKTIKEKKHTSREKKQISKEKKPISEKNDKLWNDTKRKQLDKFMQEFSKEMNQNYKSYDQTNNVNFYGVQFPNSFSENKIKVGDQHVFVAWSNTGEQTADYSVVAIYSDIASSTHTFGNHLYLFALKDQNPVVLITEQNQGMPDGMIHFNLTKNKNLSSNFDMIIKNTSTIKVDESTK